MTLQEALRTARPPGPGVQAGERVAPGGSQPPGQDEAMDGPSSQRQRGRDEDVGIDEASTPQRVVSSGRSGACITTSTSINLHHEVTEVKIHDDT
ncbi:hypothetical protein [Streptomyces nanshensis]|uniref:hypothetical protein n=1 Tax=Streptomyces nanshensis TaxID=518642 RepID=UPI001FD0A6D2|nr:hypothetical protein [Streptomyces nanshensis]